MSLSKNVNLGVIAASGFSLGLASYLLYSKFLKKTSEAHEKRKKYFLSAESAKLRNSLLVSKELNYSVLLILHPGNKYEGAVTINFQTAYPLTHDFEIDFQGTSIEEIIVSGHHLHQRKHSFSHLWDGFVLRIPKENLIGGLNSITIRFSNSYSNLGIGLHSFIDEDGCQYLYSQCESDYLHRIFPCLDQPDLKATFHLTMITNKSWKCISNEKILNRVGFEASYFDNESFSGIKYLKRSKLFENLGETYDIVEFHTTPLISTYLFSINAGHYEEIHLENTNIPISFYCRRSLLVFLQKHYKHLFEITEKCLEFYANFFKTKYPFSKYDQIFCPEFNMGAMEHPGAVTIADEYLYKDEVGLGKITYQAILIAHEMAHMWFGNLVTMKWWDDLWLNESFADYFSHFCLEKLKSSFSLGDISIAFNGNKAAGYRQDQFITTHPVAGVVRDTEEISNLFDGITYCKGAAILQQLMFLIGEESFSISLHNYFNKYKWKNADSSDFFKIINEEFQKKNFPFTLEEWRKEWIHTAGLNDLEAEYEKTKHELIIHQRANLKIHPKLRCHKIKIAFFDQEMNIVSEKEVMITGAETILPLNDLKFEGCLLNFGDLAYAKVILDTTSFDLFKNNLHKCDHPLTRSMLWFNFYQMVKDAKISSNNFIEIFNNNIVFELNESILSDAFTYAYYSLFWTPLKFKNELKEKLFETTLKFLTQNEDLSSSIKTTLKEYLITFGSESTAPVLLEWLVGSSKALAPFNLSLYNEWDIIFKLFESEKISSEEKLAILHVQLGKDHSEQAKQHAISLKAIIADENTKQSDWSSFLNPNNPDSRIVQEARMIGFNNERKQMLKYAILYFDVLLNVSRSRDNEFSKTFQNCLFPITDDFGFLEKRLEQLLEQCEEKDMSVEKFLKEKLDEMRRRMNCCERFVKEMESRFVTKG